MKLSGITFDTKIYNEEIQDYLIKEKKNKLSGKKTLWERHKCHENILGVTPSGLHQSNGVVNRYDSSLCVVTRPPESR